MSQITILDRNKIIKMRFIEFVRRANYPGVPECSRLLRVLVWVAVLISLFACQYEGELTLPFALGASIGVTIGMVYSYFARNKTYGWLKLLLALGAVLAFLLFFHTVSTEQGIVTIGSVEAPLAVLFTLMQVLHSFDVRARRDLMFSIAGSATLMAVAAAQATGIEFGLIVVVWVFFCGYSLVISWSNSSYAKLRMLGLPMTAAVMVPAMLVALVLLVILPSPQAEQSIAFPHSIAHDLHLPTPGMIASGGSNGQLPARSGSPSGKLGIGGYLGFDGPLNLAVRGQLGNTVVMRVRATAPGYWLGGTFDHWNGVSWTNNTSKVIKINGGPEFTIPPPSQGSGLSMSTLSTPQPQCDECFNSSILPPSQKSRLSAPSNSNSNSNSTLTPTSRSSFSLQSQGPSGGTPDSSTEIQTFYIQQPIPSLIFGAEHRSQVWFNGSSLYIGPGRSIRTGYSMGPGTIYTVVSHSNRATPAELAAVSRLSGGHTTYPKTAKVTIQVNGQSITGTTNFGLPSKDLAIYTQLPTPATRYTELDRLTHSIVRGATSVYSEVKDLENWMAHHVKYTTDIPPLLPGQDAVNQFIFHTRTGYCEQISTSLAVMLRLLGVPAREAVGYVPGSYNPITDLYDVQAKDAHAWVQVWFPGFGWQSFDPTAHVPLANPSPGSVIIHTIGKYMEGTVVDAGHVVVNPLVWIPFLAIAISLVMVGFKRRRQTAPALRALYRVERKGARVGIRRYPYESLREYANRLAGHMPSDDLEAQLIGRLDQGVVYPNEQGKMDKEGYVGAQGRRRTMTGSRHKVMATDCNVKSGEQQARDVYPLSILERFCHIIEEDQYGGTQLTPQSAKELDDLSRYLARSIK